MATEKSRGYGSYRVMGLPAGPFGETYVITTATMRESGVHRTEFFIVSKRHKPNLHWAPIEFTSNGVPEDVLRVDEKYLLSEARQQAENYLEDALYQLAEKHGPDKLAPYHVELVEMPNMPLLSLWMRGELHEEIRTIAKETESARLRLCLSIVTQSSILGRR